MDPVTHVLTGAVLARTGFNRRAAYATLAMAAAAEFPDIDYVWSFFGPIVGLQHHRGITHTFLAVPFQALLITGIAYGVHRLRKSSITKANIAWGWLYLGTLLALLTHLLLDWTNNYGVRPFFPFDAHYYAGSFVFIVEPILLLILTAALVLPSLFALINAEVGARRTVFRGRPSAIAALIAISAFYIFRYAEHANSITLAQQNAPAETTRIFSSPHPVNPFIWHIVTETPAAYQLSTLNTSTGITEPSSPADMLFKPAVSLPILAAKRTFLGRIYLDWSQYPVLSEAPDNTDPNHPLSAVTFADARFLYNVSLLRGRDHPPISGTVLLDMEAPEGERVISQTLDGRAQK